MNTETRLLPKIKPEPKQNETKKSEANPALAQDVTTSTPSTQKSQPEPEPMFASNTEAVAEANSEPMVTGFRIHPIAQVLPPSSEKELAALAEDISVHGLLHPVVIHDGMLLDGRSRATACARAGVKLRSEPLPEGVSTVEFVLAANFRRRQLTPPQRAIVALRLLPHLAAEAARRKRVLSGTRANPNGSKPEVAENLPDPDECGEAREQAAKATGANARYVSDLLRLQREAPDLLKNVESGKTSIRKALQELEGQRGERGELEMSSERSAFLVVLWDGSESRSRAPEKSYDGKTYPHLAFFHFYQAGDFEFGASSQHGLTRIALFPVLVASTELIRDKSGVAFCEATCRYLSLSLRGNVPAPAVIPDPFIDGYDGVIEMIAAMFPTALKVVSTTLMEAPMGWEHVHREAITSTPHVCKEVRNTPPHLIGKT